jgi:hypothetical protein
VKEGFEKVEVLSRRGSLREAAANLFVLLHRLDNAGFDTYMQRHWKKWDWDEQ